MAKFKLITRLLGLVKSFRIMIILAVINGIIGNLCSICISVFAALGLIKIMGYSVGISLTTIIIIMISLGVLRGVLRYFEQYSNHYIAFKILAYIRHVIFEKLRVLAPAKLETKERGALTNQITSDVETLEVFYAHTISPVMIAFFVNGMIVIFLSIYTHILFGMIALLFYLIIGIIIPYIIYQKAKEDGMEYRNKLAKYNAKTLDMISGRKDILVTNSKDDFINDSKNDTFELVTYKKRNTVRFIMTRGYVDVFIYSGLIIMVIVGSILASKNMINPLLILVAIITYLASFGPIIALSNLPSNLNQTFASAKRLFALLDEKPIIDEIHNANSFNFTHLELSNVSFSYNDKPVLDNISFSLNKGEAIGIIGPSGIGKSTIIKLLMQFYPYNGSIKINGLELKTIDHASLYDNLSMFSQNTYLFNDTVRNNILIAKPNAKEDQIIEALKKASIYDFVMNLEKGLDTVIKEDSINISLGEKQRLGLARVLLRKPKLLLLDEPTSNIDSFNEAIILNALEAIKNDTSIIIISHKKTSLRIADKVYQLRNGILYG